MLRLLRVFPAVLAAPRLTATSPVILRRLIGLVGTCRDRRPACGRATGLRDTCTRFCTVRSEGQNRTHPAN
jgi:hypothetical protein